MAEHYAALRGIRTRKALLRSELWKQIGGEVERVTSGLEHVPRADAKPLGDTVRVAAWNIQRGRRFDAILRALREEPLLASADVVMLAEVDSGMARSGNRHVARELADALGMSFVFGVSYLVLEDDWGENPGAADNQLALAGAAILTRAPFEAVELVDLPELRDKFSSSEKRLGKKRALAARLAGASRPLTVAACHLDSNASPLGRAAQLESIAASGEALAGGGALLVGGDLNTTTYDLASPWALARNLLHKLFVTGFVETLHQYMTPELRYERDVFEVLRAHDLAVDGFNDRASGTLHFDLNDPFALQKTKKLVGNLLTRYLQRRLRPWNGRVPARLDWFAGRALSPVAAYTVDPRPIASDHAAIVVDVRL
ncbi:MAG: metal-dependent hydrolase [Myxococcales bacterium]|nr:metal-dependent hydrolase [Myxococcales bacterium]